METSLLERFDDGLKVVWTYFFNGDFSPSNGTGNQHSASLNAVRNDGVVGAMEFLDALDNDA